MSPGDTDLEIRGNTLRISLVGHGCGNVGHIKTDLRWWYRTADGNLKASTRGISIPINRITDIIQALTKLREQAITDGALTFSEHGEERWGEDSVYPTDF